MIFEVGQTVIYPHHGAATISAINMRTIKGAERVYLKLNVHQTDLTIELPADNVEMIGLRDVIDTAGMDAVLDLLGSPTVDEPVNWSRRYKANGEKMGSGNVNSVAEVVRDLWHRDRDRGVSAGEKRMLQKARQILTSEVALAQGFSDEDASIAIEKALIGNVAAEPAEAAAVAATES